jgi:acylphosphatase
LRDYSDRVAARAHVVVRGRVQGVSFRVLAGDRARSRGIAGWVRNRPDGAVEAVFEGTDEAVDSLIAWCEHGPAGAVVDSVEVAREQPRGEAGFSIR